MFHKCNLKIVQLSVAVLVALQNILTMVYLSITGRNIDEGGINTAKKCKNCAT